MSDIILDASSTSNAQEDIAIDISSETYGSLPSSTDAEERRVALRKAGQDFFDKALQNAKESVTLEQVSKQDVASTRKGRRRRWNVTDKDLEENPDLVEFGRMFDAGKLYFFMALFLISQAASPVLVKGSLHSMQTPAVLLFLHMLATVVVLLVGNSYGIFGLPQWTAQHFRGAVITATLWGLQMLCQFSTLHHNSVLFVLTWSLFGRQAILSAAHSVGQRQRIDQDTRLLLSVGGAAVGLEIFFDTDKVWVGFLMMTLWTLFVVLEAVWQQLKADPTVQGRVTDYKIIGLLKGLSDDEDALTPDAAVFLKHALPAVPILLLGFVALEGRELVNHELSVPAVTVMLLAVASHVVSIACELQLEGQVTPGNMQLLKAGATLASIVMFFLEEYRTISRLAVMTSILACLTAYGVASLRKPL